MKKSRQRLVATPHPNPLPERGEGVCSFRLSPLRRGRTLVRLSPLRRGSTLVRLSPLGEWIKPREARVRGGFLITVLAVAGSVARGETVRWGWRRSGSG